MRHFIERLPALGLMIIITLHVAKITTLWSDPSDDWFVLMVALVAYGAILYVDHTRPES